MKRRDFIKTSALASGVFFVPQFLKAFEGSGLANTGYRKLVIVQLSGGNDGLNTVVPYRADPYYQLRPSVGIASSEVLKVSDELGLNPALTALRKLYDDGELTVVNQVGYPNPNRSHFRSMDIWQTASASNEYLTTGWLGRYMDANCQHAHQVIEVDDTLSLALKGKEFNGISASDPKRLYQTANEPFLSGLTQGVDQQMLSEDNMGYLYKTLVSTQSSATYLYETSKVQSTSADYPVGKLGKQFKQVAQFINSGVGAQVYYVSASGFDTHAGQKASHHRLLENYGDSLAAFVKDLKASGQFDDTLIVTFSEFGRRVKENGSKGTDHGTANNLFVVGKNLKTPGFYNNGPNLLDLDENGDLKFQVDFRRVYASLLNDWLMVDAQKILGQSFDPLALC